MRNGLSFGNISHTLSYYYSHRKIFIYATSFEYTLYESFPRLKFKSNRYTHDEETAELFRLLIPLTSTCCSVRLSFLKIFIFSHFIFAVHVDILGFFVEVLFIHVPVFEIKTFTSVSAAFEWMSDKTE